MQILLTSGNASWKYEEVKQLKIVTWDSEVPYHLHWVSLSIKGNPVLRQSWCILEALTNLLILSIIEETRVLLEVQILTDLAFSKQNGKYVPCKLQIICNSCCLLNSPPLAGFGSHSPEKHKCRWLVCVHLVLCPWIEGGWADNPLARTLDFNSRFSHDVSTFSW